MSIVIREDLQKYLYRQTLLINNMVQNSSLSLPKPVFNKHSYIFLTSSFTERNQFVEKYMHRGRGQNTPSIFPII